MRKIGVLLARQAVGRPTSPAACHGLPGLLLPPAAPVLPDAASFQLRTQVLPRSFLPAPAITPKTSCHFLLPFPAFKFYSFPLFFFF